MNQDRRTFIKLTMGGVAAVATGCSATSPARTEDDEMDFYVGTYTRNGSQGIYRATLNPTNGAIRVREAAGGIENPSFLAISSDGAVLFAVSETGNFAGGSGGSMASFAIDGKSGELRKLSQQPSGGAAPAYVSVNAGRDFVLVANYNGGNVSLLPVNPDGSLEPPRSIMQHTGSSVHPQRQQRPHAHSIVFDPAEEFAIAADLGIDRLVIYRVLADEARIAPADPPAVQTVPGAGPRHLAWHPRGDRLFVINELNSTLTSYAYDGASGTLEALNSVPTLPQGFTGQNTCADVHVAPSGRFVYGSNRGHDSIVVCGVDAESGEMSVLQHHSTGGRTPRNFALDPSGRFLIVANQDTNNLVVLAIDGTTGRLSETGEEASIPVPVCVKFAPTDG